MSKIKVYIIVLTWNRKDLIINCLKSLQKIKSKYDPKVVVVDNYSKDDTVEFLKKNFKDITLIKNSTNLGWSGGNNKGIKYALRNNADYIVLLNNDIIVDEKCIDLLIDALIKEKKVGIVSPKIYRFGTPSKIISNAGNFFNKHYFGISKGAGQKDKGQFNNIRMTDFVAGVVCARAEVYRNVGLLDENYFLYFEDADYCMRAIKKGFLCMFVQDAILYHLESATIGVNSPSHTYYNTRNHLLFLEKYCGARVLTKELVIACRLAVRKLVKRETHAKYTYLGVRDYLLRRFNKREYW